MIVKIVKRNIETWIEYNNIFGNLTMSERFTANYTLEIIIKRKIFEII